MGPPIAAIAGLLILSALAGAAVIVWALRQSFGPLQKGIVGSHPIRELGGYELVRKLGSGGMGEVWCARHRLLRRPAAIKVIVAGSGEASSRPNGARLRERFEREAQVTACLESPHTVALYDFGIASDGTFYHVMELLRGRDLESMVAEFGPLPAGRVVPILLQICDSLDDAHGVGLVHRDIKPANIVLTRRGRRVDYVKVLDFGLVKLRGRPKQWLPSGSLNESVPGTPAYMAPEIVNGDENIDGRVDLYALGCVAYWLMTGTLVFEETTALGMMIAHASKTPIPPSLRAEQRIPPALERLVLQCLSKSKEDRPVDARALARSLRALEIEHWSETDKQRWWGEHLPELLRRDDLSSSSDAISPCGSPLVA